MIGTEGLGGSWLTEPRVIRLGRLAVGLRVKAGWPLAEVRRRGWSICGGPLAEIDELLTVLETSGLATRANDRAMLTKAGDKVAIAARRGDFSVLALALLRSGLLHQQARRLLEVGHVDQGQILTAPQAVARAAAPQLVGLLVVIPGVRIRPVLTIPSNILSELTAAWALLPPVEIPTWAQERKQVGDRAEYYTWLTERSADPDHVFWVGKERDDLGYDVEDRRVDPPRRIEVKGRRDNEFVFYLSENEWRTAELHGTHYEVQFWGGIDLNRTPQAEYLALRAEGWPVSIIDPVNTLSNPGWERTAVTWRVRRIATGDSQPGAAQASEASGRTSDA